MCYIYYHERIPGHYLTEPGSLRFYADSHSLNWQKGAFSVKHN